MVGRLAIDQDRLVNPLLDGFHGRWDQQWVPRNDIEIPNASILIDRCFQNNNTLNMVVLGWLRVNRRHLVDQVVGCKSPPAPKIRPLGVDSAGGGGSGGGSGVTPKFGPAGLPVFPSNALLLRISKARLFPKWQWLVPVEHEYPVDCADRIERNRILRVRLGND